MKDEKPQSMNDNRKDEARSQSGASRKGSLIYIVPPVVGSNRLDSAYRAGLAGHLPVKYLEEVIASDLQRHAKFSQKA